MKKALKTKWLKALRSGKFTQARGTLADTTGALCCIGVCAVVKDKKFNVQDAATCDASALIGLTAEQETALVALNDYKGRSFKQIALYIERHL